MAEYPLGTELRLKANFTEQSVSVDPTAGVIIVRQPDGECVGYPTSFGFVLQGSWDAQQNSPTLLNGTGTAGHYYTVSVAGKANFGVEDITFAIGDWVFYNGKAWRRLPCPSATTLQKEAVGIYYVDQLFLMSGRWFWRAEGVGARAAGEDKVLIKHSVFA